MATIYGLRKPRVSIEYSINDEQSLKLPFVIGVVADLSGCPNSERLDVAARTFEDVNLTMYHEILRRMDSKRTCVLDDENIVFNHPMRSLEDFEPFAVCESLRLSTTSFELDEEHVHALMNKVLHKPLTKRLESTWRGIHFLLRAVEPYHDVKVKVLDLSKDDLEKCLRVQGPHPEDCDLYTKIVSQVDCINCLVGDYYFDQEDLELLARIAHFCESIHVPFLSGASSSLLGLESWGKITGIGSIEDYLKTVDLSAWNRLRELREARFVSLVAPRYLAREPFRAVRVCTKARFDEVILTREDYTWSNACFCLAALIGEQFGERGWFAELGGFQPGGLLEGLPVGPFPDITGAIDGQSSTEVAFHGGTSRSLVDAGIAPLGHYRNTPFSVFECIPSLVMATGAEVDRSDFSRDTTEALSSAESGFAAILGVCRFVQFIKKILQSLHGKETLESLENYVNRWISNYLVLDSQASLTIRYRYPLSGANVAIDEDGISFRIQLRLHGMSKPLTLVLPIRQLTEERRC